MATQEMENKALQIVKENALTSEDANRLQDTFKPYFAQAEEWVNKANQIKITDASQIKEMTEARTMRINLKNIRIAVENRRKELKEDSLRKGKAIDGFANILKMLIEPVEEYLENQEKFVEIQEKKRLDELELERKSELVGAGVIDTSFYDLRKMPKEQFDSLLAQAKESQALKIEAEKRAEAERLAKEEADRLERQKQAEENARLKKEAEARELELKKEREAKAKVEAELKAKAEAEAKEKARIEAEKKAEEKRLKDEEKKKAKMSDSDKVKSIIDTLKAIRFPEVKSDDAKQLIAQLEMDIAGMINKINNY